MAGPLQLLQFGVELEALSDVELAGFCVPEVLGSSTGGSEVLCVQHWPENSLHILSTTSLTTWSLNYKRYNLDQNKQVMGLIWNVIWCILIICKTEVIKARPMKSFFKTQYPVHVGFKPSGDCFFFSFHPFVFFGHSLFMETRKRNTFSQSENILLCNKPSSL